jgi:hypothetical protein
MAKLLSGTRIYGTATVDTTLFVDGTDDASSATTGAVQVVGGVGIGGTLYVEGTTVFAGDLAVNGGDLTTTAATFNLINANATTVNFAGAATTLEIGAATGTTNINNNLDVDGDVNIDGGDLTVSTTTFNLANTTATAVNFAGAATSIEIGSAIGVTNINNNLDVDGDVNIDGGDLTVSTATFNLANGVATTVNAFGAGTAITIGDVTGTTTIRNANTVVTGDLAINGGDITSSAVTFNILPTTSTTVNAFGAASALNLGATNGTTIVRNNFEVDLNTVLNGTLTVDLNATVTGDLAVNGGDITTSAATFNLINANATTVNFAGAGTSIIIGAATGLTRVRNNFEVDGDVTIDGGDLIVSTSAFNLANTTATTGNLFGAATTVNIGAAGSAGILTVRNDNVVLNGDLAVNGGDITTTATTFNLITANATTVNAFTAATTLEIGAATGTTNINNNLDVDGDVNIDGGDLTVSTTTFNLANANATTVNFAGDGTAITIGAVTGTTTIRNANTVVTGDLAVNGADITTTATGTATVFDTNATTVNAFGAATSVTIGAAGSAGTLIVRNDNVQFNGDLQVRGGDLTTNQATFNLVNTTATTVNFAGAATTLEIGAATGTTNINNNLDVDGDVNIDGGDLTVSTSTFNLANTTATTVNAFGAATTLEIGAATGTTNINNNLDVDGDVNIDGGDLTVSTSTFNLANTTATTVNFAGAATTLEIGAATGTTNINNNLDVDGDVNIDGGDLTVSTSTFNLANTTATTGNLFGDGTAITIGAVTGTTTIRNANTVVTGDLAVNGADITTTAIGTATVFNTNATTVNAFGAATAISIGAATGTTTINNANTVVTGDLAVNGADITTSSTGTANVFNTNATTVNAFGAATAISIGAATGTTTINNTNTVVTGDLAVNGADITTTSTSTATVFNTNATAVNAFGAATSILIGAGTGTTEVNNNLQVDLDLDVRGGDITTNQTTFNLINTTATTGNLFGVATGVNVGISAAAASTLTFGPAITGNIVKIRSTTSGTVDLNSDVTSGIVGIFDNNSGTTNLANAGTINLGKSSSATTLVDIGGAITGNSLKISGTAAGTVTLNSDVTTGIVNLFNNVTTGTINVATAGGSTINLGGTGSTVNVKELTLTTDLAVQYGGTGVSTFTTNGILFGNAADPILVTAASNPGSNATTSYGILSTDINNVPVWTDVIDGGSY